LGRCDFMDQMSVCDTVSVLWGESFKRSPATHTNVQQDSAIFAFVDDMVLKDLVIQGSGFGGS